MGQKQQKIGFLIAFVLTLSACEPAQQQTGSTDASAAVIETIGNIPRRPDGKPDFNGIWQVLSNANSNLEASAPKAAYALVPGDFVPVPAPEVVAFGA